MTVKKLELQVDNCMECPYCQQRVHPFLIACCNPMELDDDGQGRVVHGHDIPDWCPLEDVS